MGAANVPISPPMVMLLVPALSEISKAPPIVLKKLISWAEEEVSRKTASINVTGEVKRIWSSQTMALPSWTLPAPVCEKGPLKVQSAAVDRVNSPLLATWKPPAFVVVTVLLNVNAEPVRLMPSGSEVARVPLNVVMPVPELCVMRPATMLPCAVTFAAEETTSERRGLVAPTAPFNAMLPAPAARNKLRVSEASPSMVPEKVIVAPGEPVDTVALATVSRTTAVGKTIGLFTVVTWPPRKMVPAGVRVRAFE